MLSMWFVELSSGGISQIACQVCFKGLLSSHFVFIFTGERAIGALYLLSIDLYHSFIYFFLFITISSLLRTLQSVSSSFISNTNKITHNFGHLT